MGKGRGEGKTEIGSEREGGGGGRKGKKEGWRKRRDWEPILVTNMTR